MIHLRATCLGCTVDAGVTCRAGVTAIPTNAPELYVSADCVIIFPASSTLAVALQGHNHVDVASCDNQGGLV